MKEETVNINDNDFFLLFNIFQMKNQIKISFGKYQKKANPRNHLREKILPLN